MKINGDIFRDMVVSAANALDNNKEAINNLNVFPVPDGDTGINMSLTMSECRTELGGFDGTLSDCAEKIANIMLRGGPGQLWGYSFGLFQGHGQKPQRQDRGRRYRHGESDDQGR